MSVIVGLNPGHNGSVAVLVDGKLDLYIEEERLSRMKYDGNPYKALDYIVRNYKHVDELVVAGTTQPQQMPWTAEDPYGCYLRKFYPNIKKTLLFEHHHLTHAASAFYGSGFDKAAVLVIDGSGSVINAQVEDKYIYGYETETIYNASYEQGFDELYKSVRSDEKYRVMTRSRVFDDGVTITKAYEAVSQYLGFGFIEAGKTMGLAPYGEEDDRIPQIFLTDRANKNMFIPHYPAGALINESAYPQFRREEERDDSFSDLDKNLAYSIQKASERQVIQLIEIAIERTGLKNICISGGFGLNCVANYEYLKHFPDCNFYIDPIAHDGGTAIGAAKLIYYGNSGANKCSTDTLYYGTKVNYEIKNDNFEVEDVEPETIAQLIADRNIVCMFNERSEGGPRALGNRSILYDPRDPNGKDFVNKVKGREWFRPFAGSMLVEYFDEWFETRGLKETPYMMYAINVLEDKRELIPCITHVDGTCRIQTVSRNQNKNYYDLIEKFYKKTGVPILFNTSFNLAGDPLVETLEDAFDALERSELKYLYVPELGKLFTKK